MTAEVSVWVDAMERFPKGAPRLSAKKRDQQRSDILSRAYALERI
jgi:hypothetical protein